MLTTDNVTQALQITIKKCEMLVYIFEGYYQIGTKVDFRFRVSILQQKTMSLHIYLVCDKLTSIGLSIYIRNEINHESCNVILSHTKARV